MDAEQFRQDLRASLVHAATHGAQPRTRSQRPLVFATIAAAIAAVVIASLLVVDRSSTAADVMVLVDGDDLVIELRSRGVDADEVRAAAQEVGLDVTVEEVPVGPSNVGRFVGYSGSELPPTAGPVGDSGLSYTAFRIPRGWDGEFLLRVGRPAEPGEQWEVPSNAFLPGEPAECLDLLGASVRNAEALLAEKGLTARWFMLSPSSAVEAEQEQLESRYADWRVVQVESIGDDQLLVSSTEDGSWPFPPDMPRPKVSEDC